MRARGGVHVAAAAAALLAAALAFAQEESDDGVPPKVLAVFTPKRSPKTRSSRRPRP
jgi:hypothetical protein